MGWWGGEEGGVEGFEGGVDGEEGRYAEGVEVGGCGVGG